MKEVMCEHCGFWTNGDLSRCNYCGGILQLKGNSKDRGYEDAPLTNQFVRINKNDPWHLRILKALVNRLSSPKDSFK